MSIVLPFQPNETQGTTSLTVEIEYLHHIGPHHRDSEERRREKAETSARARIHEQTRGLEYPRAIEHWCASDLSRVIDLVRADMPTESPDGCYCRLPEPDDLYQDGRALVDVAFDSTLLKEFFIWFGTQAGYAARVLLPACPSPAALIPWALDDRWGARIELFIRRKHTRRA